MSEKIWCDRCKKPYIGVKSKDDVNLCESCTELMREHGLTRESLIAAPMRTHVLEPVFVGPDGPHYMSNVVQIPMDPELAEEIFHPAHYIKGRKYEPAKVAYDWGLDFNLGSALKYISRAGRKAGNPAEKDIAKAIAFLIKELESIRDHEE